MMFKKVYLWTVIISFTQGALISLFIILFFPSLPYRLPLFYSLPWGDEQLAAHIQFLIIPAISILITLLNLVISSNLHIAQIFFKKILIASNLFSLVILTITFLKIVLIFV